MAGCAAALRFGVDWLPVTPGVESLVAPAAEVPEPGVVAPLLAEPGVDPGVPTPGSAGVPTPLLPGVPTPLLPGLASPGVPRSVVPVGFLPAAAVASIRPTISTR